MNMFTVLFVVVALSLALTNIRGKVPSCGMRGVSRGLMNEPPRLSACAAIAKDILIFTA